MTDSPLTQLQHVVLFKFPQPLTDADEADLFEIVAAWEERIGTLVECRIGRDLTGARAQGFQYLLLTVFTDAEALRAYVVHPAHQALVAFVDARDCERLAFDYYFSLRP